MTEWQFERDIRCCGHDLPANNPSHTLPVGNRFVILRHGRLAGVWPREEISPDRLSALMSGAEA
jgi:hypothetical protein